MSTKLKEDTAFTVETMVEDLVDRLNPYQEVHVVNATGNGTYDPEMEIGSPGRFMIGIDIFGGDADEDGPYWVQEGRMVYHVADETIPNLKEVQARIQSGLRARAAQKNKIEQIGEPMPF